MSKIWRKTRRGKLENISPICQFAMFFWWCWMLTTSATALISSWRQTHLVTNHGVHHTRKFNPNPKMYILLVSSLLFFPLHVTLTFFDHISHSYCKKKIYIHLCLFFLISILLFSHSKVSSLSLTLHSLASPLKSLYFSYSLLRVIVSPFSLPFINEQELCSLSLKPHAELASLLYNSRLIFHWFALHMLIGFVWYACW